MFQGILKVSLRAKNGDVSSSTPKVRPESMICTREDEHPRPFHTAVPFCGSRESPVLGRFLRSLAAGSTLVFFEFLTEALNIREEML